MISYCECCNEYLYLKILLEIYANEEFTQKCRINFIDINQYVW